MSHRLAIVLSHPVQYYSPWFRWMTIHSGLQLRVFYLDETGVKATRDPQFATTFVWDVDLLSGYDHEFVPNTASRPGSDHFNGLRNPALTGRVATWRPDAVLLFGYNYHTHLRLLVWARLRALPVIFRGDSHLLGRDRLPVWKHLLLTLLYRQFAAFVYVGAANHDYFRAFGVPSCRLYFAPHSVDADRFTPNADSRAVAADLRASLGLKPTTQVVLFAGKFVPAKQPRELLTAFLANCPRDTALVFVGDGPERPALEALAATAPPGMVHFLPFANQSEMPAHYLLADIFVLPSRGSYETWGLAVNEAMHMGLPCLVSDRVGCQRDLVTDGETGWVFTAADPAALGAKLTAALDSLRDPATRERLRDAVKKRITGYTYAHTTAGLLSAINRLAQPK